MAEPLCGHSVKAPGANDDRHVVLEEAPVALNLKRVSWVLGMGVALAIFFELLGRMLYQLYQVPFGITGPMTFAALLIWGGVSLYVVRRLRSAPRVIFMVSFGAGCLVLSQAIHLICHFKIPLAATVINAFPRLQSFLEEGFFVLGLALLFSGFYVSLFEARRSTVRTAEKQKALMKEVEERRRTERALKASEEELRRLNEDLEHRVQERTTDLTAANKRLSGEIARREETEQALRESETQYRTLVQNASSVILRWRRNGEIVFLNEYGQVFFGFSEADGDDWNPLEAIVGNGEGARTDPETLLYEMFENPETPAASVIQWVRRDGTALWVAWTHKASFDARGRAVEMLSIGQDVTAEKRIEAERMKLQAQLTYAQKMESVGTLAGGVAHNFNNMLGVILGRTELALKRVDPSQPVHTHLKSIQSAAERSANLTRQLLTFARRQDVVPKAIDLNAVVIGMFDMLRQLVGENVELAWHPGVNLWLVKIDPGQVDQVLANLCLNARDAIEGIGRVTLETSNYVCDEACDNNNISRAPGEYVMLTVSDTGVGMTEEVAAHIFEPFYTTKQVDAGIGLGLATVYGMVNQNGGHINVCSEPGKGTTFRIYLPRYDGALDEDQAETPEARPAEERETVLLVEDEPDFLDLVEIMLENQGYHVLSAGMPGEALRMAEGCPEDIRLLITDVVMPEMNGYDLARKLSDLCPNMKCLFMSGYTAGTAPHLGVDQDKIHFIEKPFSSKDLVSTVCKLMTPE